MTPEFRQGERDVHVADPCSICGKDADGYASLTEDPSVSFCKACCDLDEQGVSLTIAQCASVLALPGGHVVACQRETEHEGDHGNQLTGDMWGDDSADKPTAEQARALAGAIEANPKATDYFWAAEAQDAGRCAAAAVLAGETEKAIRILEDAARALREEMEAGTASGCKGCGECDGEHHWIPDVRAVVICKHCTEERPLCDMCDDGAPDDDGLCLECRGEEMEASNGTR